MGGLETALSEVTLALFTTLAPSGAVACALMPLCSLGLRLEREQQRLLHRWIWLPLVVSMAGLVASSTHLGNPGNALYVFTGTGRSPLSTEVTCAVVYLALTGTYWLYSFAEQPRTWLCQAWLSLIAVSALLFVGTVGQAYSASTILTWDTWYVQAGIWANAFLGGPLLALATVEIALSPKGRTRVHSGCSTLSVFAFVANSVIYILQGVHLREMENSLVNAVQLVPHYGLMLAAFIALCALGIAISVLAAVRRPSSQGRRIVALSGSCLLVFCGIFIMRFAFYMMHMTMGLGV